MIQLASIRRLSTQAALLAALTALLAPQAASAYQTPEAVLAAMDLDMTLVSNVVTPDTSVEMFDVRSSLGVISPQNAPSMGVLFTGNVDQITNYTGNSPMEDHDYPGTGGDSSAGDYVTLGFDISVPDYANSFSFNFNFLSREYPEWVGSAFNDTFEVHLDSGAYQGQIVFDAFGNPVTVNNALFVIDSFNDSTQLPGTGFDQDGGTGWVTTIAPCDPGEVMHLSFEIYDVSDGVWDSGVLIDNFMFNEEGVDNPDTTADDEMVIAFVSPKEGDVDGGNEVTIHGKHLSPAEIHWGDTIIDSSLVTLGTGGETLTISAVPAHAEGEIDLQLIDGEDTATLLHAYTYWTFGEGDVEPRIISVGPDEPAHPNGGALIRIRGKQFDEGAQVYFVDAEGELLGENPAWQAPDVPFDDGSTHEIAVNVPAHVEGWVDLVVENNTGLRSDPGYPFLYSGEAQAVSSVPTDQDGTGCSVQGVRRIQGGTVLLVLGLGLIGLIARRRRDNATLLRPAGVGVAALVMFTVSVGCGDNTLRALPNQLPLAVAAIFDGWESTTQRRLGYTVLLETAVVDGSRSRDPDNDAEELEYFWSFETIPSDSALTDENIIPRDDDPDTEMNEASLATIIPDVLGTFRLNLIVRDRKGDDSSPAVVVVQSVLPSQLQIDLDWTDVRADLDLHLLKPGAQYFSEDDCFSWHSNPDWGDDALAGDNPILVDEDGEGEGPFREVLFLEIPEDTCNQSDVDDGECDSGVAGDYRIWVHYYSDHSAELNGAAAAVTASPTVTISVLGEVLEGGLVPQAPLLEGQVWKVGELSWPDRELTVVDSLSTHVDESGPAYNVEE